MMFLCSAICCIHTHVNICIYVKTLQLLIILYHDTVYEHTMAQTCNVTWVCCNIGILHMSQLPLSTMDHGGWWYHTFRQKHMDAQSIFVQHEFIMAIMEFP